MTTEREKENPVSEPLSKEREAELREDILRAKNNLDFMLPEWEEVEALLMELDRLREEKVQPAGRELSEEEREELARARYETYCHEHDLRTALPWEEVNEIARETYYEQDAAILPYISRLLAERESRARGLALAEAAQLCPSTDEVNGLWVCNCGWEGEDWTNHIRALAACQQDAQEKSKEGGE